MKTITCISPGNFELSTQEKPQRDIGEALVRIRRVGVCGTDIHAFAGNQPFFSYPRVLGHELAGEIVETGGEELGLTPGDRVAILPYLECGKCVACRSGRTNCCCEMNVLGVHSDGGMQEYITVPVDHLIKSETLAMEQLAMVECISIGAHAVRRAAISKGEKVLVVGAGPIGLGLSQMAQIAGSELIIMDIDDGRLSFCRKSLGVQHTINAKTEDPNNRLAELTDGDFPTVIFDCTGNPESMMRGFSFLAHGGRYILVSLVLADITFNDPEFHKRETTLLSSRNATKEDFMWVMECMEKGLLKIEPMITHHCQFEEIVTNLPKWGIPGSGVIKAMVELE